MSRRIAFVFAVIFAPLLVAAQPLADHVPADAMLYVGWRGSVEPGPGYAQSNLKAVLDDSQIPEFIDRFLPEVIDKVSQMNPQAGQVGQIVSAIAKPSWQHPTAFFFSGVEVVQGQMPVPHLGIIWQPGPDADALAAQLEKLIAQALAPFPIKVIHQDSIVALLVGYARPEAALAGRVTKSLADDAHFKSAMSHLGVREPISAAYVDYERIFAMVDDLIKASGDADAANAWPKLRDDLGLQGLKRLAGASGFDGKDYGTELFADAPEPRSGLLKLSGNKPLGDEILAAIPETVTTAGAGKFDLAELFDLIHHTAGDVHPDALRQLDSVLAEFNSDSGVDVRKDLLASLGNEWAYFADPMIGGRGLASLTMVNHLEDPEKFEQSLEKMEDYALKQIQKQAGDQMPVRIAFETTKVDGMTIHYLAVPLLAPSWVVRDGNLYVSLFPQVAAGAARHAAEHAPSITTNPGFVAMRARLGQQNPSAFTFVDLPKTAPDAYGAWLFISRLAGFGDVFGIKSPPMIMPELSKLMSHLSPAGSVNWVDAEGFHVKSIEPFPGSTVVASDPSTMALYSAPTMISILLPALNRAREQANRIKSASNLRQIGMAAIMYANTNKGKLPPDLATMYKQEDLTPFVFINPRSSTAPPPAGTPDAMADWVEQHSDYVYVGKGRDIGAVGADAPLAYEKLEDNTDGVNVLFGDGHVEFFPMSAAQQLIEKSKAGAAPDGKL